MAVVKDLGAATAYGYAREKGYTGTEEEFAELMASYATVAETAQGYANDAADAAVLAGEYKDSAASSATQASGFSNTAAQKAGEAVESATAAANSATAAGSSASTASGAATEAGNSATAAGNSATSASASAMSADADRKRAEALAAGTIDGTPVGSGDDAYNNNAKYYRDEAGELAEDAEAWANGTRNGVTILPTDEAYEKNAKYWAGQAGDSATAAGDAADRAEDAAASIPKYDDLLNVIKVTDNATTMGEITAQLAAVNAAGDHVVFDVSALNAGMYLCTIYIGSGYYRIYDLVTGFEGTGFFAASDLLTDIIKSGSQSTGKHYTVKWDQTNAQCVRLNDAVSITTDTSHFGHFGTFDPDYSNPFDDIYPWSGRKLCNISIDAYRALTATDDITDCVVAWEGDEGFSYDDDAGVWVYTPPFFGRSYILGNDRYFDVTDENLPNNIAYPAMITGRYLGCGVTLTIDGTDKTCNLPTLGIPLANVALSTQHTYAKNYGGSLTDIYSVDASLLLMIVEYATMNSQNAIGQGAASLYVQGLHPAADVTNSNTLVMPATNANFVVGAIVDIGTTDGSYNIARTSITAVNGATLTLADAVTATTAHFVSIHGLVNVADEEIGSESGYIGTNGKATAYYRGEELYGNKWQYTLGAYRQTGTAHVWVASRSVTDNYDALNTSAHTDTGVVLASNADVATDGYIDALGLCDGFAAAPFATAVGGNETNPVGDRIYSPNTSAANTILLLGGYASYGTHAGAFYGNWGGSASYSSWNRGSRPRLKIPREGVARGTLPLA